MKKLFLALGLLLSLPASAIDTGSADQAYVIPHAGGRAKFGKVDLSQSAAAKFGSSTGVVKTTGGTLSAATIVDADVNASAAIARSKLGTGTAHGAVVNDSSGNFTSVVPSTARKVLMSNGTDFASTAFTAPTVQRFTSTTQTGWILFLNGGGNATAGATYTNNSNTYTVLVTMAGGTYIYLGGTGTLSGTTLTKASGTGDATLTIQNPALIAFKIGVYTTPTNPAPISLRVRAIGGGGGGAGSSTVAANNGNGAGSGTDTIFTLPDVANLTVDAGGGSFGEQVTGGSGYIYGSGGAPFVYISASIPIFAMVGANGSQGLQTGSTGMYLPGGCGGGTVLVPSNCNGLTGDGANGYANSGAGGSGGGTSNSATMLAGGGGGGGAYGEAIIPSPAASYYYSVGTGGAGASAGTSGHPGGAGAAGILIVEENYQ